MSAAGDVLAQVSDPRLVEERRGQIVRAAVKLFSEEGYYPTTIQKIARAAGVSTGLIYQYFRDKDDVLFLTLKLVLDTYEHDIPPQLEGVVHPVEQPPEQIARADDPAGPGVVRRGDDALEERRRGAAQHLRSHDVEHGRRDGEDPDDDEGQPIGLQSLEQPGHRAPEVARLGARPHHHTNPGTAADRTPAAVPGFV